MGVGEPCGGVFLPPPPLWTPPTPPPPPSPAPVLIPSWLWDTWNKKKIGLVNRAMPRARRLIIILWNCWFSRAKDVPILNCPSTMFHSEEHLYFDHVNVCIRAHTSRSRDECNRESHRDITIAHSAFTLARANDVFKRYRDRGGNCHKKSRTIASDALTRQKCSGANRIAASRRWLLPSLLNKSSHDCPLTDNIRTDQCQNCTHSRRS